MIEFKEVASFMGEAVCVSNGTIEFTVALEAGPRVIAFNKVGEPNIFFQDTKNEISRDVSSIYGKNKQWNIYGGHRLWLSPENDYTYVPDNETIAIERLENGVLITGKEWRFSRIIPSIRIEFDGKNSLTITHKMVNNGKAKELCLWGLTVLKAGGKMEVFLEEKDTGLLPNRNIVLWPYTDIKDDRLEIFNNKITLKSTERVSKPLKLGLYNQDVRARYTIGHNVFIKEFCGYEDEMYPDYGCNFETYISNLIHEIESLSPIKIVDENGSLESVEKWTLE